MKKAFLAFLAIILFTSTVFAFSDVPETHWANKCVTALSNDGIINGYADGSFKPEGTLTRAEFLAMCVRAKYGDLQIPHSENWWQPYLDTAKDENWNIPFDAAEISKPITRKEIALLLRGASVNNGGAQMLCKNVVFTDDKVMAENLPFDMYNSIIWASAKGLVGGYPDGSFKADGNLTRAEAATVIRRLMALNEIAEQNGEIVVFGNDFVIYNLPTKDNNEIISINLFDMSVIDSVKVHQVTRFDSFTAEDFAEYIKGNSTWSVLNSNSKYFWGLSGFYEYDATGKITQITELPVIDYGHDSSDNSFVFITHPAEESHTITTSAITYPVGNAVIRFKSNGEVVTLADENAIKAGTKLEDGTPYLLPIKVHYATGGKVQVVGWYNWGMGDLREEVFEISDNEVYVVIKGAYSGIA